MPLETACLTCKSSSTWTKVCILEMLSTLVENWFNLNQLEMSPCYLDVHLELHLIALIHAYYSAYRTFYDLSTSLSIFSSIF